MEELKNIPVSFQRKHKSQCYCCETIKEETVTYDLQIEIMEHSRLDEKRYRTYRLYYKPTFYYSFKETPKIIGQNTGMGKENITELVDELKEIL